MRRICGVIFFSFLMFYAIGANADCGTLQAIRVLENKSGSSPALADFNNDGKLDLAMLHRGREISIRLGNGDHTFQPPKIIKLSTQTNRLVTADLNRDGWSDLVLTAEDSVRVIVSSGASIVESMKITSTGLQGRQVIVSDFNSDEIPDLLMIPKSKGILIANGRGDGRFHPGKKITGQPFHNIASGQLNGDHRPDIVAFSEVDFDNSIANVFINIGGNFRSENSNTNVAHPVSALLADLNKDGLDDLTFGLNDSRDFLGYSIRLTNGGFRKPVYLRSSGPVRSLHAIDMNQDQKIDLVYIIDNEFFAVRRGLGNAKFAKPQSGEVGILAHDLALGDLNSDGVPDGIATGADRTMALAGDGRGSFHSPRAVGYRGFTAGSVAVADFNRDGNLDIAASIENVEIINGAGNGKFQKHYFVGAGMEAGSLLAVDLNRDGNTDLVVVNKGVSVLLGKGDGFFQNPRHFATSEYSGYPVVGDFNGDGIFDLAMKVEYDSALIMIGQGDGSFSIRELGETVYSLGAADFNRDGKTDLILSSGSTVEIQLSNGDGSFRKTGISHEIHSALSFIAPDLDLDGNPDLVIGPHSQPLLVLRGMGDGTFGPLQKLDSRDFKAFGIAEAVADYDNDGRPDFLGGGSVLFLNRTDPNDPSHEFKFDVEGYTIGGYQTLPADMNGDGAVDFVSAADVTSVSVVFNQPCQ